MLKYACRLHNPSRNFLLQLYESSIYGNQETALIRKASEERISNRWKKHSGLTQSSQQLKRDIILIPFEEELDEVFPANKAKKELILLRMPFLGLHKSKVWNKHMVPFCLLWEARDPERRNKGKSDADKVRGIRPGCETK